MKRYTGSLTRVVAAAAATGALFAATAGVAAADPTSTPATPSSTTTTTEPPSTTTPPPTISEPPTAPTTTGPTASEPSTGVAHLTVSPSRVHPGSHVTVRLACLGDRGPVESGALTMGKRDAAAGSVYTDATVRSVDPGTYKITATCGDDALTTSLTVLGSGGGQVSEVPQGPVDTGDGSLAGSAGATGDAPWLVGGLAVLAGGGLAGYAALRRHRGSTGQ